MDGDIVSMVYYHKDDELYFLEFDFSQSTVTSALIYNNILEQPFTTFMGTGT